MSSTFTIPAPLRSFYSLWPLHTWPPISPPQSRKISKPTLWILPPRNYHQDQLLLSSDVECLKWQAFLALRGLENIAVRWDVSPDGAVDGRLPNLHVRRREIENEGVGVGGAGGVRDEVGGELLAAHMIPGWADKMLGGDGGSLFEGYRDEAARDESHAWVSLLEGKVHAALILSQPQPSLLASLTQETPTSHGRPLSTLQSPPPPPLSGISSLLPPYGTRTFLPSIELQYKEAITSLSERLGTDKWFLGSEDPTALDALSFAYLHTILHTPDPNPIRIEVTRRVNLVAWERKVRAQVAAAFHLRA